MKLQPIRSRIIAENRIGLYGGGVGVCTAVSEDGKNMRKYRIRVMSVAMMGIAETRRRSEEFVIVS